ncbi:hypothetical protein B0H10DRAFT_2206410 [Mycena sp. CBHHK59/15]|nr:hypothetical protein B0H10DRAFT_2206410 [Mycena sp. CBHHK59/15]
MTPTRAVLDQAGARGLILSANGAQSGSNMHLASDATCPDFPWEVSAPQMPRSPFIHRTCARPLRTWPHLLPSISPTVPSPPCPWAPKMPVPALFGRTEPAAHALPATCCKRVGAHALPTRRGACTDQILV